MKAIFSLIISGALVVSGYAQTRNVLVGTNNAVVQPTNFWSADASNARTGLGLGTAATNPASAFQPSSAVLSNLASSNGVDITNIQSANISGTIAVSGGGTGATNAAEARTNLELGATWLTNTDITNFRTAIGLGATNAVTFGSLSVGSSSGLSIGGMQLTAPSAGLDLAFLRTGTTNMVLTTNGLVLHVGSYSFSAGNTSGAAITRTNLDLGESSTPTFSNVQLGVLGTGGSTGFVGRQSSGALSLYGTNVTSSVPAFYGYSGFASVAMSPAEARTNIGLPFAALTNTNTSGFNASLYGSGTNPVLVNSNGSVVSPTNFWQSAPIATTLQTSVPTDPNSTNAATNARLLFLFSLAPTTVGVTNTITLPTNGNTFNGDVATITHSGPTSSVTAIRQLGASTNIITLNQVDESVRFLYRNNQWTLMDNISYIEPIYFSGTNAAANAAASRTNLGGTTVGNAVFTATNAAAAATAIGLGVSNQTVFNTTYLSDSLIINGTNASAIAGPSASARLDGAMGLRFLGSNAATLAAITRTNLGGTTTGNAVFTATNAAAAATAIGLGTTNAVTFDRLQLTNASSGLSIGGMQLTAPSAGVDFAFLRTGSTNMVLGTNGLTLHVGGFAFSGGNTTGAAITRTNLGGTTVGNAVFTATNAAAAATAIGLGATNNVEFNNITISDQTLTLSHGPEDDVFVRNESGNLELQANVSVIALSPISFNNTTNAAITRTNLGLPLAALTNTTVSNFQKAIFYTNTAPSNVGGNLGTIAAWIEIVASNGVTYKIPAYTNVP